MTCYRPLDAYKSLVRQTAGGKAAITFSPPAGPYETLRLPCGQCIGCRIGKSQEWALRCVHEASLYGENSFVTLTYDDGCVPLDGSLCKKDYQDFLKRLRSRFPRESIRYFLCGEYGESLARPHYHALLFNHDFPDKTEWCESKGNKVFRSLELEELWPYGFSWIGEVTWQSAAYVARYVLKKVNGERAWDRYCSGVDPETGEMSMIEPEFIAMSRRPGIGREWYEKYKRDLRKDFLTHEGVKRRVPRYYDGLREVEDLESFVEAKRKRKERATRRVETRKRLQGMEKCLTETVNRSKRSI